MISLKETKFSIRQCSLILLPVDVVSGSARCSGCPAALTPSGMLAANTCKVGVSSQCLVVEAITSADTTEMEERQWC